MEQNGRASLAGTAALITAVRGVQMSVNFGLAVWLARRLSLREHATYLHVMTLAAVLPVALCAPLGKLVTYYLPRTRAKGLLCRRAAFAILGCGALLAAAVAFVPGAVELADRDGLLVDNRTVAGLVFALSFPYAVAELVMIARGAARQYAAVLLGVAASLVVGVGGGQFLAGEGRRLEYALWGVVPAFLVQAGAGVWFLFKRFDDDEDAAPMPTNVASFFVPLLLAALLFQAGARFDAFVLPQLYPADRFPGVKALYLRGAMETPVLGAFALTAFGLAAPEIARLHAAGNRDAVLDVWRRTGRMVALVTLPAVGLVESIAHEAFPLLYGAPYLESVPVFRFAVLALVARVFMPQALLEFTGAAKRNLAVSAATLALVAAFSFLAVYGLGMGWLGFAVGGAAAMFVANWGVGGAVARGRLAATWSELADWGSIARLAAAAAAGFVVASLASVSGLLGGGAGVGASLVRIGVLCAIYGGAFVAAALPLRAVRSEDFAALRRIFAR